LPYIKAGWFAETTRLSVNLLRKSGKFIDEKFKMKDNYQSRINRKINFMDFKELSGGSYSISGINQSEYGEVMRVWEISVRASHDFLKEEDILIYKKRIYETLPNSINLFAVRGNFNKILGFMGTSDEKIEMLFIIPEMQGRGIGKSFIHYAVNKLHLRRVDVNEQNKGAVSFYNKMGFLTKTRSEIDMAGKPYPILHLELSGPAERTFE
jgi:putative acetyltransferase